MEQNLEKQVLQEDQLEEVTGGGYETKRAFTPGGREGIACRCSHPADTEKYDLLYGDGEGCPYSTTSNGSCVGEEGYCKYFSRHYF